jgi:hypothetical protein
MVVATELPEAATDHRRAHGSVQGAIEQHLAGQLGGVFHPQQSRSDPIVFHAPGRRPLAFFFYDLAEPAHDFVKQVVYHAQANQLAAFAPVRGAGIEPLGVMPHWLGSAQQEYSDGSPASFPRPAGPWTFEDAWLAPLPDYMCLSLSSTRGLT